MGGRFVYLNLSMELNNHVPGHQPRPKFKAFQPLAARPERSTGACEGVALAGCEMSVDSARHPRLANHT